MSDTAQRFELQGEFIELNQLLKLAGFCNSGGEGKHLVAAGLVHVDGQVELRKTCKIREGQRVRFEGREVAVVRSDH
ncbi:MAG: RNA-binding S4 domain-containing protein [Flavobacteriales bacterium]|nr:RNA-binding S4 domain-containing protein [Flavobacteriales bacterium]